MSLKLLYFGLTALFLLTFGISEDLPGLGSEAWAKGVFTGCSLLLTAVLGRRLVTRKPLSINVWLAGVTSYGSLVLLQGLVHLAAIVQLPGAAKVNVLGLSAGTWLEQNYKFTILYLYFPVLCLLQYMLIKRINRETLVRTVTLTLLFSLLCLVALRTLPDTFRTGRFMGPVRFQALSISPNAYALTVYLLLPWITASVLGKVGTGEKALYACCFVLFLKGVLDSGSRTGSVLVLVFLILTPVVVATTRGAVGRRVRGALLAVPALLVVGLVVIFAFVPSLTNSKAYGPFAPRFQDIGERLEEDGARGLFFRREARGLHALVAWLMLSRSPLGGWGPGGFYREFPNAVFLATGRLRPTTDSALNHYLMIGGDLGLPCLAVNVLLISAPLWLGYRILKRPIAGNDRLLVRLLILSNLGFLAGINFMPPSYFLDVLWLWTGQLAYLVVLAEKTGVPLIISTRRWRAAWALFTVTAGVVVFLGAFSVTHGSLGYSARRRADWWPWRYGKNCYPLERWSAGEGCWCKNDALLQIPFFGAPPETVHVQIGASHPDIGVNPVIVRYGGISGTPQSVVFNTPCWKTLTIPVTDEYLYSPTASRERHHWKLPWVPPTAKSLAPREIWYFLLALRVSRTWIPMEWDKGEDERELGVMVLLPEGRYGRGCLRSEQRKEGSVRWCGKEAVLQVPIPGVPPDTVEIGLGAFHPDLHAKSVTVEYGGLSGPTESVTITAPSWRRIRIPITYDYLYSPADLYEPRWRHLLSVEVPRELLRVGRRERQWYLVLSLQASRGWTPEEWCAGDEIPELGVAVLLPEFKNPADCVTAGDDLK